MGVTAVVPVGFELGGGDWIIESGSSSKIPPSELRIGLDVEVTCMAASVS